MNHRSRRMLALAARLALPLLLAAAVALAGPPRPIALTGTDGAYGPQLGVGVTFANFYTAGLVDASPALNAAGKAAFLGRLAGAGIGSANDTGVWVQTESGLRLAARTGDAAPGTDPGVVFSGFYTEPMLDANGHTAFKAIIAGPGVDNTNNDGLWSEGLGTLRLVIRENVTPVPDGGGFFVDPSNPGWPTPTLWGNNPLVMNAGAIAQRAFIYPGLNPWNLFGAWTDRSGTLGYFIRADQEPVPGFPPWYFFAVGNPTMNASGAMIAVGVRASPSDTDRWGVWTDRTGSLTKVIETGDAIPGLPGGVLHSVDDASINAQGRIALLIEYEGSDVPEPAILSDARYGVLQLIAKYNTAAPGTGGGVYSYLRTPVVSDNGVTAFSGRMLSLPPVTEATSRGIWSNSGGTLHLVARSNDPAPGLSGITYNDFYALAINATGQVAFIATLSDGIGLFLQDAGGAVQLVVRDFEPFDVFGDGSDIRLTIGVATPTTSGNPYTSAGTGDGRRIYFNDNGDLAFRLSFVDGSEGIFTTAAQPSQPGDMNCDGLVNGQDIDGFVYVLFGTAPYTQYYEWTGGGCNYLNGDMNGDGLVNGQDIDGFVTVLFGG